jgi:hypothetical protein
MVREYVLEKETMAALPADLRLRREPIAKLASTPRRHRSGGPSWLWGRIDFPIHRIDPRAGDPMTGAGIGRR